MSRILSSFGLCVALAMLVNGQPKIQQKPMSRTSPTSGQEMYIAYCASCHGKDAKGNGPAAPALKKQPTDLTMLSKSKGGTFPANEVYVAIGGQFSIPSHGSRDMPIWGELFSQSGSDAQAKLRLANLTKYIESIQAK
jgi:mono/diheme cytochrome c family protein